jgi:hypothetical protein
LRADKEDNDNDWDDDDDSDTGVEGPLFCHQGFCH